MTRRNEPTKLYGLSSSEPDVNCITTPDGGCIGGVMAGKPPCMHDALPRHMTVQLQSNRESFTALKELLRGRTTQPLTPSEETAPARITREALLRVFNQIRDTVYNDSI